MTQTQERLRAGDEGKAAFADRVLDLTMDVGNILLENGAEVSRVEETMRRISTCYGLKDTSSFVLSNGIFISGEGGVGRSFAKVKHIPVKGAQLDRVVAVNQLSRAIEAGEYTLEEAEAKVREIRTMKRKSRRSQVLASGLGAACYCVLLGGRFSDALVAGTAGLLLYLFLLWPGQRVSKMTANLLGSLLAAFFCTMCRLVGLGSELSSMVIGSVIPLIPGVAFVNGVRDLANGDYLSGWIRLLDAMLVFLCIAVGVGVVIAVYQYGIGGIAL